MIAKTKLHVSIILIGAAVFFGYAAPLKSLRKEGAAPGYTGSPGDGLKNCTECHGGVSESVSGWVTSNIPAEGYVPGKIYTITATNSEAEATRFGFEVSPQDIAGNMLGTIVLIDTVKTQLVGSGKYITYTENGVQGVDKMSWQFDWIAPSLGSGNVTFYGAFNSNFDGHKEGDKTFLSTLKVAENTTGSVSHIPSNLSNFSLYPMPSSDKTYLSFHIAGSYNVKIEIVDIAGKKIAEIMNETLNGKVIKEFSTSQLQNGTYLVRVLANGIMTTEKLLVNH